MDAVFIRDSLLHRFDQAREPALLRAVPGIDPPHPPPESLEHLALLCRLGRVVESDDVEGFVSDGFFPLALHARDRVIPLGDDFEKLCRLAEVSRLEGIEGTTERLAAEKAERIPPRFTAEFDRFGDLVRRGRRSGVCGEGGHGCVENRKSGASEGAVWGVQGCAFRFCGVFGPFLGHHCGLPRIGQKRAFFRDHRESVHFCESEHFKKVK